MLSRVFRRLSRQDDDAWIDDLSNMPAESAWQVVTGRAFAEGNEEVVSLVRMTGAVQQTARGLIVKSSPEVARDFLCALACVHGSEALLNALIRNPSVDPAALDNLAVRLAAEKGLTSCLRPLLDDNRVDPSAQDNAALRAACANGSLPAVSLLLKHRSVDARSRSVTAALGIACERGYSGIVRLLLSSGADPASGDGAHFCRACAKGHTKVAKCFLKDERFDMSSFWNLALNAASRGGHVEVVKLLMNTHAGDASADGCAALRAACAHGRERVVRLFLRKGVCDLSVCDSRVFVDATRSGNSDVVRMLLAIARKGVLDLSLCRYPAVCAAVCHGHASIAKELMIPSDLTLFASNGSAELVRAVLRSPGVDPGADDSEALVVASSSDHDEIVMLLLEDGRSSPGARDSIVLRNAAVRGRNATLAYILSGKVCVPVGAVPADPCANCNESIRMSSANNREECIATLIKDGRADASSCNSFALRVAAERGYEGIVGLLISDRRVGLSADPSACDSESIRIASRLGFINIVSLLLADGRADPGARDSESLMQACGRNHVRIVSMLLADGRVDPSASHSAALRVACRYGHTSIVEMLIATGKVDAAALDNECVRLTIREIAQLGEYHADHHRRGRWHIQLRLLVSTGNRSVCRIVYPATFEAKRQRGMAALADIIALHVLLNPNHPIGRRRLERTFTELVEERDALLLARSGHL